MEARREAQKEPPALRRLVLAFSTNPARILKLDRGTLAPGSWADVTVIDPELRCQVKGTDFSSRSRNSPFEGWTLTGGPVMTIVKGKIVSSRQT